MNARADDRRSGRAKGTVQAVLAGFVWYVGLLSSVPLLARSSLIVSALSDRTTDSSELIQTPLGIAYAIVVSLIFLAFVIFASNRRHVFWLYVATLVGIQIVNPFFGWDRIGLAVLVGLATGLVVEAFRQNRELFIDLAGRDKKVFSKAVKAVFLWSPMLGMAYLGTVANEWLTATATNLVYATTPIDLYCREQGSTNVLPCEGKDDESGLQRVEFTLEKDLQLHVEDLFRQKQVSILIALDDAEQFPDQIFIDKALLAPAVQKLVAEITPARVLGLPAADRTEEEVLASDAEYQRLTNEIKRLGQPRGRMRRIGGVGIINLDRQIITLQTNALRTRQEARRTALLQSQPKLLKTEELQVSLPQKLIRALEPASVSIDPAALLAKDAQGASSMRALLAAQLIAKLTALESSTLLTVIETAKATRDLRNGLVSEQKSVEVPTFESSLEQLGIKHYCSNSRESEDVYDDDEETKKARINLAPFVCTESTKQRGALSPLRLEASVDHSISDWRRRSEARIESATRTGFARAINDPAAAADQAMVLDEMVPKDIHLGRKHCRAASVTSWGNCVTNYGKKRAEKAYGSARRNAGKKYSSAVDDYTKATQRSAAEQVLFIRANARDNLDSAEIELREAVANAVEAVRVVNIALLALLVLMLIKSLLYVAAIVLFDLKGPSIIQVSDDRLIRGKRPIVAPPDQSIEINTDADNPLITKAALLNQCVNTKFAPWPWSAVVTRLLLLKYVTFNSGGPINSREPIIFSYGRGGKHVVDWALAEGEEVVFRYKHFFGATKNVRLRTRISLRLSTLLLGRFVFQSAIAEKGDGHLLLLSDAIPVDAQAKDSVNAALPEHFVAWHAHTCFQVSNELKLRSVLMDPYALVRVPNPNGKKGRVLVRSPHQFAFPFRGIFRYATRLLSPF